MKKSIIIFLAWTLCLGACHLNKSKKSYPYLFAMENLVAWCIVPFDSRERSHEERAQMLNDLGIRQLAYDWRPEHLLTFPEEITVLMDHGIKLRSVWFWIDGTENIIDEQNERILKILEEQQVQTELWVSFNDQFFDGLGDEDKLSKAVFAVRNISGQAREIGCNIALYNHGGWFGDPVNQVKIIQALPDEQIGIVYNFHHGHTQIDEFGKLMNIMKPYLTAVNINGMSVNGPKILPVGQGDSEFEMLSILKRSGFDGNIGIIGHVEDVDVKTVLERNLSGLRSILERMGDEVALSTYLSQQ